MANAEQTEYWNGSAGSTWVAVQRRLDAMLSPVSEALLGGIDAPSGLRVLDVGCGCGDTSLALADAGARVLGVDLSAPMLARAQERAGTREDLRFLEADASTHAFGAEYDLVVSRFGVMFFEEPVAAFANLCNALGPEGRLRFACWQSPRENPWMSIAGRAVQPFLPEPEVAPDPRAPGPFAFAEPIYVREILEAAGFRDARIEPLRPRLHLADDLEGALEFQSRVGPLARALSELEGETLERAVSAAREALAPHVTASGLDLEGACWIVDARSP